MYFRSLPLIPALILTITAIGCGGVSDALVPVGGKLVIDGKPLEGVVVNFIPEVSVTGRLGGTGTTDDMGLFTVTNRDQDKPGLPPGKYTLSYSRRRLPDGSAGPEAISESEPGIILVETLPMYLVSPNPKFPATQVTIPEEGNEELELKASTKMSPALMGPG